MNKIRLAFTIDKLQRIKRQFDLLSVIQKDDIEWQLRKLEPTIAEWLYDNDFSVEYHAETLIDSVQYLLEDSCTDIEYINKLKDYTKDCENLIVGNVLSIS